MRNRVIAHLLMLKNNTRTNAKKLKGTDNVWRIRVGDFRIIYEIEDKTKAIKIYRIKHRSKAY
ncbi:MAG TPA: type II toxin-antitoxin system RelE/ParE family toxin [Candidatus Paceibacterota bacterium]